MMKAVLIGTILTVASVLPFTLCAQQKAAHGGTVLKAASYWVEVVASGDEYLFFVRDSLGSAIPIERVGGNASILFENGKGITAQLEPRTDEAVRIVLTEPAPFDAQVAMNIDGRNILLDFSSGPRSGSPAPQRSMVR